MSQKFKTLQIPFYMGQLDPFLLKEVAPSGKYISRKSCSSRKIYFSFKKLLHVKLKWGYNLVHTWLGLQLNSFSSEETVPWGTWFGLSLYPLLLKKSLDVYFVLFSSVWSMEKNNNLRTQSFKPLGWTWDSNHNIILF